MTNFHDRCDPEPIFSLTFPLAYLYYLTIFLAFHIIKCIYQTKNQVFLLSMFNFRIFNGFVGSKKCFERMTGPRLKSVNLHGCGPDHFLLINYILLVYSIM